MRSCPLCKHGPVRHSIGTGTYWCANVQCPLYSAGFSADAWQALPRRDETASDVARELEIAFEVGNEFDAPISRTWIVRTVARLRAIAAPGECDGVAQHRIKNLTNANAAAVARAEKAEAERDKAMAEAKDLGEALVYEGDHVNRLHRALKNTVQRWRDVIADGGHYDIRYATKSTPPTHAPSGQSELLQKARHQNSVGYAIDAIDRLIDWAIAHEKEHGK